MERGLRIKVDVMAPLGKPVPVPGIVLGPRVLGDIPLDLE